MRIKITGDSESAVAVRGMLNTDPNVLVCDRGALYEVEINDTVELLPTVDGVDSDWERKFVERITGAANTNLILLRAGGNQSDQKMKIGVPLLNQHLIERGIFQAILQMVTAQAYSAPVYPAPVVLSWWKRFTKWVASFPL